MHPVLSRAEALSALSLSPSATKAEADSAFRRLSLQHHPDRLHCADSSASADTFLLLSSARAVLVDSPCNSDNDDPSYAWPKSGPVSRAPQPAARGEGRRPRTTGLFVSPLFDALCGPHAFARCEEGLRKGGLIGGCDCKMCETADLYAPLLAKPPPVAAKRKEAGAADGNEGAGSWRDREEEEEGGDDEWSDDEEWEQSRKKCRRSEESWGTSGRGGISSSGEFLMEMEGDGWNCAAVFSGDILDRKARECAGGATGSGEDTRGGGE